MKLLGVTLLALFSISYAGRIHTRPPMGMGMDMTTHDDKHGGYEKDKVYLHQLKQYTVSGVPSLGNGRTGIIMWSPLHLEMTQQSDCKCTHHVIGPLAPICECIEKFTMMLDHPVLRVIDLNSETTLPVDRVPDLETALDDPIQFLTLPAEVEQELDAFLSRPVSFSRVKGVIRDIHAEKDMPEWILDILTGIIEKFQIPELEDDDKVKRFTEDSIVGKNCNVTYDIMEQPNDVDIMTMTKVFTLDECEDVALNRDAIFTLDSQEERTPFLQSSLVTKMNVTESEHHLFLHDLVSEARYTTLTHLGARTENIVYTRQEVKFMQETNGILPMPDTMVKRRDTLFTPFTLEKTMEQNNVYTGFTSEETNVQLIKKLATRIVQMVESDTDPTFNLETLEEFQMIISTLRFLKKQDSFKQIIDFVSTPQTKIMRPLMINAIGACGSPVMIASLKTLDASLETEELDTILTGITTGALATEESVRSLKKLYTDKKAGEESTVEQLLLAIGTQMYALCKHDYEQRCPKDDDVCPCKQLTPEFINFFMQEYARTKTVERKTIILRSIKNSGLDLVNMLEEIIENTDNEMENRFNAIIATRRCPDHEKVEKLLMAVFRNEENLYNVELRIGAMSVLVDKFPTKEMLMSLVSHMNEETDKQMGNFVYSYLENLVNMPHLMGSTEELHIAARTVLPTLKRFEDGIMYSKNFQYIMRPLAVRLIDFMSLDTIVTRDQGLPRTLYIRLAHTLYDYYVDMISGGIRMEGADNLIRELYTKVINFIAENIHPTPLPTTTTTTPPMGWGIDAEIQHITHMILHDDDITPRPIEKTRGYMFLKAFGNELGVIRMNPESVEDLIAQIAAKVVLVGETDRLTMVPILLGREQVQTLMGVPTSLLWSTMTMTSIQIKDSKLTTENSVWAKDITLRNLIKNQAIFGIELGSFMTSQGVNMHSRVIVPHTIIITGNSVDKKYGLEFFWNTEDKVFNTHNLDNFKVIELKSVEVKLRHLLKEDTKDMQVNVNEVQIHPIMQTNEQKYTFDVNGLLVTSVQPRVDYSVRRGEVPMDGRHVLTVEFPHHDVKPYGFKTVLKLGDINREHIEISLFGTLNPRVPKMTKEVDIKLITRLPGTTNVKVPDMTLEITPVFTGNNDVIRVFLTTEQMGAPLFSVLPWMKAAEEKEIDEVLTIQWGVNEEYNEKDQDIVLKLRLGKSELQKEMELLDETLAGTECAKCFSSGPNNRPGVPSLFDSISCSKCMFSRNTLSLIDLKAFTKKENEPYVDYIIDSMNYLIASHHNWVESRPMIDPVTPELLTSEMTLLSKYMKPLNEDDVIAFRHILDMHPHLTQLNITSLHRTSKMRFTNVPLFVPLITTPVENLPVQNMGEFGVPLRFNLGGIYEYGICRLDGNMSMETTDRVMFHLPKEVKDCERILAKDCTNENTFELSVRSGKNVKTPVVHLRTPTFEVEIVRAKDSFIIKVDSEPVTLKKVTMEGGYTYETFDTKHITGQITPFVEGTNTLTSFKKLVLKLRIEGVKISMHKDFIAFAAPFWYKNKLCGLCGDNNGEWHNDLVLKNMEIAPSVEDFIREYSTGQC